MPDTHPAGEQASFSLEWVQRQDPVARREILDKLADRGDAAAIAILVASLADEHPAVQQKAVNGLIRIGSEAVLREAVGLLRAAPAVRMMAVEIIERVRVESLDVLRPALESSNPSVRKLIVDALRCQRTPQAGTWLVSMLSDPDSNVRAAVAEALARLRLPEAVPGLLNMLNGDEWNAFFAASALAELGEASAVPALLTLLTRDMPAAACAAVDAIGRLDQQGTTLGTIADLVNSPERPIRRAVIQAVSAMAARKGSSAWTLLDRARWFDYFAEATRDSDRPTMLAGIRGLGLLGDKRGTRAILSAYRAMKDCAAEEQELAIHALVETGDADVLIKAVELDEDRVSDAAIHAVGLLHCREAVPALGAIRRKSWDWQRRKAALGALAQIGTDQAFAAICEGVEDATGYVRAEAVRLISESGRMGYVRRVLVKLQSERYEDVRLEMAKALLKAGTQDVMIELVDMLRYGPPPVRETAAWAIGTVRLPEGLEPLLNTYNDPEWKVRRAVVEGLANYRDEGALRVMLIALTDDHEKVRLAAAGGLVSWDRPETHRALLNVAQHDPDIWVRRCAIEGVGINRLNDAVGPLARVAVDRSVPRLLRHAAVEALRRIGGTEAESAAQSAGLELQEGADRPAA